MRIAIATVQVPFVSGGAEAHALGLRDACRRAGHEADLVAMPFRFFPPARVRQAMARWQDEDLTEVNGIATDAVVCLKFPTWSLRHARKIAWVLHQHRSVYDLWGGDAAHTREERRLRDEIVRLDTRHLADCERLFANSATVAARLARFNGLAAEPLYHPPPGDSLLYSREAEPYVFFPSRLETLKRQDLLVEAMRRVRSPVGALLAGDGGQRLRVQEAIERAGLGDRVRLLGPVDDVTLRALYASALAVFFGPRDEDYGYVTLEAMLAAKPVLTCLDSGGPLEFVADGETGFVTDPDPEAIAARIDWLWENRSRAAGMGAAGRARYHALGISWDRVVERLLY